MKYEIQSCANISLHGKIIKWKKNKNKTRILKLIKLGIREIIKIPRWSCKYIQRKALEIRVNLLSPYLQNYHGSCRNMQIVGSRLQEEVIIWLKIKYLSVLVVKNRNEQRRVSFKPYWIINVNCALKRRIWNLFQHYWLLVKVNIQLDDRKSFEINSTFL